MFLTKAWCLSRDRYQDTSPDGTDQQPLRTYLTDVVRQFGLGLHDDLPGIGYAELAAGLLAGVPPVDLLVLAFAVPDAAPWGSAASRLSGQCPGNPAAFAVCDQGAVAGFTALRLIGSCLGPGQRALLVVAEQPAAGYDLPLPAPLPERNSAVAVLCEASGTGSPVSVRLRPEVPAERAAELLAAELAEGLTLVAGNGLAAIDLATVGARVVRAPGGLPLTGVWTAAAGLLGSGPLLLADYDPLLGVLALVQPRNSSS